MTQTADPAGGTVLPLRRPPVRQSTVVRSDRAHTFDVFVATIGAWWPVVPFSAGGERVRAVTFEQRLGGRVYETWDDGSTVDWGTVLAWDPPHRFAMTWNVPGAVTEVELSFTELAPALTRVAVEHRGWEALSDAQLSAACALPGGYTGGAFDRGWATILGRFATALTPDRLAGAPDQPKRPLVTDTQHFVFRLTPPRPTFAFDQSPHEAQVMADHIDYWRGLLDRGIAVVFGPVLDPAGGWGLAVAEVESPEQAEQIRLEDPVTRSGIAGIELHPMLSAVVRPLPH